MRKTLLAGLALTVAAVVVVLLSATFDLELESVALLGAAVGAVVALVPDRTPLVRLAGFFGGFLAALVGYFVRAALLPDSAGGRTVAVALVLILCVALAAASRERLPLWSILLGAAALTGAYEFRYAAAPPEVATTSISTVTALLFTLAAGFLAAVVFSPDDEGAQPVRRGRGSRTQGSHDKLDDLMMEKTK